ncbi:putative protein kinase [Lachnospiraceae bacterium KM106-2]|nr:putative protein kinase [Lachnospiraceae bacterium KM106-2]
MLKLRNLVEHDELVLELLQSYNFTKLEYGFYRASSNVVYWVKGDGKLYFLRYTTKDERTSESIQEELDYIRYLRTYQIKANQPVRTISGTYLLEKEDYLAVLFEAVPGKALEDVELNAEIIAEWGRQLGKIHKLSKGFIERRQSTDFRRADYKEKLAWIRSILDEKEIELRKEADWLEESFNHLIQTNDNYGMCHYDFELDNVYFDEPTNQFSIIDFDDCMYHFFSIDYEQVMMNIEEVLPVEIQSWVKEEFRKGYREENKIPDEEELKLAYEFIVLLGYTKLTYSLTYVPEDKPDWMDELIHKLDRAKSEKREWLMKQRYIKEK